MKLAFVVPRYGAEILGGAEFITRQFAEHLPVSEFEVEVLTTRVRDFGTCENVYPAGVTDVNGVRVRRFPVDLRFRNAPRFHELTGKILRNFPLTVDEEYEWIDNNIHSPLLYAYLRQRGRDYDLLFFGPYLFGLTFYGMTLCPERSVLWPCLHDETFAYFLQTRLMLGAGCGVMFNSEPEMALAQEKLGVRHPGAVIVGGGMVSRPAAPERFRAQFGLSDPFILYAGRLEPLKNVAELLAFFVEYKQRRPGPLKLVVMGEGGVPIPPHPDIIPIGFQEESRKLDAFAAAMALVQPSLMESFSLVIMESWLTGAPVLVHGDCAVTHHHVARSNGGLSYTNFAEFAGALDWLLAHPTERAQMGELGRAYVQREYNWETVIERFRNATVIWQGLVGQSQEIEERHTLPVVQTINPAGQRREEVQWTFPLHLPAGETLSSIKNYLSQFYIKEDGPSEERKAYLAEAFQRFLYTLQLIPVGSGKLLEIGANPYFMSLLAMKYRDYALTLTNYFGEGLSAHGWQTLVGEAGSEIVLEFDHINVEQEMLPYATASFDVVLLCEVLEHFTNDPLHALLDIKRVLKPQGTCIITTPNFARWENIIRLIAGDNFSDVYSAYGPYGRHNREYTLKEVKQLLEHAGFAIEQAFTTDIRAHILPEGIATPALQKMLSRTRPDELGQYIFVCATNQQAPDRRKPAWLYRSYPDGALV